MPQPSILLCTVGTSLFKPNLEGLKKSLHDGSVRDTLRPLAEAYANGDFDDVARCLAALPAYDNHEFFPEIIAFPPLPVALDFDVWMRASGMLFELEGSKEAVAASGYEEDWDERYESLVERVTIDDVQYLELSATGQIFHE